MFDLTTLKNFCLQVSVTCTGDTRIYGFLLRDASFEQLLEGFNQVFPGKSPAIVCITVLDDDLFEILAEQAKAQDRAYLVIDEG